MTKKQRTILSVAYPLTEVGPDAVGGSEQILTRLDRAVVAAGHRSIVIAAEGSSVEGTLIPSPVATGTLTDSVREWGRHVHRKIIQSTLAEYDVDLVHMHSLDFHSYLPADRTPVLATLHLPPDWYPESVFHLKRQGFWMNCVSESQYRTCPESSNWLDPIPNGVELGDLAGGLPPQRSYALCLGRICPEKGFHLALAAARSAGTPLLLAGQIFPYEAHLQYFDEEISPLLDERRRFIGPVRLARKKSLLAHAKCLVITSTVAETSSLVAMEALASGTPVIAFRIGALPEIVADGRTGFIVDSVEEMASALRRIHTINPQECRREARRRFSSATMASRYLDLYADLIGSNEMALASGGRRLAAR